MVNWNTNAIAELEQKLKQNLLKAAILVSSKIKEKINRGQPYTRYKGAKGVYYEGLDPSKPGEPPKRLTGQLTRSITYRPSSDGMSYEVGSNIKYAAPLEFGTRKMAARPYIRRTLAENQDAILKILQS